MNKGWEVKKVTYRMWRVYTEDNAYFIWFEKEKWKCSGCPSYVRKKSCNHIRSVWEYLKEEKKRQEDGQELYSLQ